VVWGLESHLDGTERRAARTTDDFLTDVITPSWPKPHNASSAAWSSTLSLQHSISFEVGLCLGLVALTPDGIMLSTWLDLTPLASAHRLQETEAETIGAGYPAANAAPPPASAAGWDSRTHVMLDTHLPLGRVPPGCSRCALYVPASAVSAWIEGGCALSSRRTPKAKSSLSREQTSSGWRQCV
jgi:hypothetical protein